MTYLHRTAKGLGTPPQSEPLDERQVKNSAGGYVYPVTDQVRLERFLILGSEGGSYYASEHKLTMENAKAIERCIKADGPGTVKKIVEVSEAGRAYKNDPALFALAMCAASKDIPTRKAAYDALPKVARIGTHLFHFAAYVDSLRGWSRGLRNAVQDWYLERNVKSLQNQLVKYQARDGWSHRDLLRLAHPTASLKQASPVGAALRWTIGGVEALGAREVKKGRGENERTFKYPDVTEHLKELALISAFEKAKGFAINANELAGASAEAKTDYVKRHVKEHEQEVADLVKQFELTREMVPTEFQNSLLVWEALFEKMPMTAMIRNLATMTRAGLLTDLSATAKEVGKRLRDQEELKKARVHPIGLLLALKTYSSGKGFRSQGEGWTPVQSVVDALDDAFYLSFGNLEPTGKTWYLGVDVSSSMVGNIIAGSNLSANEGAAAMSMVIAKVESDYVIKGFCHEMRDLRISPKQRLDDVAQHTQQSSFGGTDCALPILDATNRNMKVDVFCTLTDGETWAGEKHANQALKQYRQKTGIAAKLIMVGMCSNGFSICDPDDAGQMDVVGFDANAPTVMADFARQVPATE